VIEIRRAESEEDIAAFLAVSAAVDPDLPMTREAFDAEPRFGSGAIPPD
jgi:hypothetical protein